MMYRDEIGGQTLAITCRQMRIDVLEALHEKQTGHPGGSLSVCEILASLYLAHAKIDPCSPDWDDRDRIILSKGHAAPMLYRVLAEAGFFSCDALHTLRDLDSKLQGHPCARHTPGVDFTSGPLGLGLSAGLGMVLALRFRQSPARVYVILGDGELNEGTIWEACMAAAKYRCDRLCAIVDYNGVQLDGKTSDILPTGNLAAKFEAFGWNCIECDGHDTSALCAAYTQANSCQNMPSVILARTVKGKGVSFMEGKSEWHGKSLDDDHFSSAIHELMKG